MEQFFETDVYIYKGFSLTPGNKNKNSNSNIRHLVFKITNDLQLKHKNKQDSTKVIS